MSNAIFKVPTAINEPVKSYSPGSPERKSLKAELAFLKNTTIEIASIIGGKEIKTGKMVDMRPPHELSHLLGQFHKAGKEEIRMGIDAALAAKKEWANLPWQERAAIFLKAADLLAGPYRDRMNAATMLSQSKNVYQAEIDAACETADFFRYNVQFMSEIYAEQPYSPSTTWNKLEYRPLEGFVFALTPFNFTSIAANLPSAPALMGNTVVWKPAFTQVYSAKVIMDLFKAAGLPDGVINLVLSDGPETGEIVFSHPEFAGIHFTGSSSTFNRLWKTIGDNISNYRSYPRIVGETGGKDFVVAHSSAIPKAVAVALSRGAFEYQGQKCSAASRAYIPSNIWGDVKKYLLEDLASFKMGSVEDFSNFINAVIDEKAYNKITSFISDAKQSDEAEIIAGGNYSKEVGYFIEPTVIVVSNPKYITMEEELFGPVLTIYIYDENKYEETLDLVNETSPYALTGAIFSQDRYALQLALKKLENAAGNFYINDKPTGAVVGQQPFGGSRASGTNDKAGSKLNLLRWISARTIKENFLPPLDYRYPFLSEE